MVRERIDEVSGSQDTLKKSGFIYVCVYACVEYICRNALIGFLRLNVNKHICKKNCKSAYINLKTKTKTHTL